MQTAHADVHAATTTSSICDQAVPGYVNLISNCGFETGDFTGWTVASQTDITVESNVVNSGSYATNITGNFNQAINQSLINGTLVTPQDTMSAFAYPDNSTGSINFYWDFRLVFSGYVSGIKVDPILLIYCYDINSSNCGTLENVTDPSHGTVQAVYIFSDTLPSTCDTACLPINQWVSVNQNIIADFDAANGVGAVGPIVYENFIIDTTPPADPTFFDDLSLWHHVGITTTTSSGGIIYYPPSPSTTTTSSSTSTSTSTISSVITTSTPFSWVTPGLGCPSLFAFWPLSWAWFWCWWWILLIAVLIVMAYVVVKKAKKKSSRGRRRRR